MGHGQHSQLSFSGDGRPPRFFQSFPDHAAVHVLPLLSFASFGFSLCPFYSLLPSLLFFFFLLSSLLLVSSFLLCHNQTKPDSQEQVL